MTYRKGEVTARMNERMCPHIVEVAVPENGFGPVLNEIHTFHETLAIKPRQGRWRRKDDRDYARWCFADPQYAAQFQAFFGGELIKPSGGA